MSSPFEEYDLNEAEKAVNAAYSDTMKTAALFYDGDHWQNGAGYIGPKLSANDEQTDNGLLSEIERLFTSRNAIGETVDRHKNGVTGREVVYDLVVDGLDGNADPSDGDTARIKEAKALLDDWLEKRDAGRLLGEAVAAAVHGGRGALRIFVPPGKLEASPEDGGAFVPSGSLEESMDRIYLNHPSPASCLVVTDADSQEQAGIYTYTRDKKRYAELVYLDGDKTVLRVAGSADGDPLAGEWGFDLGGRLTIREIKRNALITASVMTQQRLLNLAETMKVHNVIAGGFLERVILNAQPPGHYETDENGKRKFVREPLKVGASATSFLTGVLLEDSEGNRTMTDPSVQWREPVPVETFQDTVDGAYAAILGEVHQLHYAMAGDAVASGESRVIAMADYVIDLLTTKKEVDKIWSWLLETVLAMAAMFSGKPNYFDGLRVTAEAQIDAGPISTEMMRAVRENVLARLMSYETGMSWIGIADTDAETAKIEKEQAGMASGALSQLESLIDQGSRNNQQDQNDAGANDGQGDA